jgi:ribosomal protein L7/L12
MLKEGADDSEIVAYLHGHGATIIESIKVLRDLRGISLGTAKEIVSSHPVWHEAVSNAETLHADAIAAVMAAGGELAKIEDEDESSGEELERA